MVVAWRLGVVVHAPDHDDDQGVAQTNDEQHRDYRHGERRLIKAPLGLFSQPLTLLKSQLYQQFWVEKG